VEFAQHVWHWCMTLESPLILTDMIAVEDLKTGEAAVESN
jgi:hypothetical protein